MKDVSVQNPFLYDMQSALAGKQVVGVAEVWIGFKSGLLETADKACGQTKGSSKPRETWWWNNEVVKVVEEKRRQFKVWKKSKCETNKAAYNRAKKVARTEVAKAQQAGRKNFGDVLDRAENIKGEVCKVAKQIVRKNKDVVGVTCVKRPAGKARNGRGEDKDGMEGVL